MSLGDHIRSLRGEKNLSQNDLAELLSVSRQSVSKWETDCAIPDLDKLVSLSEIFGVSLDTLIKGTPTDEMVSDETPSPMPAAEKASGRAPHYLIGIILLCFGALITLLLFFIGGGLWSLLFASPVLLCGLLCLYTRRRTGLWCGWTLYLSAGLYLRYATGITWSIILLTPHFEPSMNYMRLAIGWGQFLLGILLICMTLWSFRTVTLTLNRKHVLLTLANLLLLVGLGFAQNGLFRYFLRGPQSHDPFNQGMASLIQVCGDYIRLGLFVVLLVQCAALLRQWRSKKAVPPVES